MSGLRTIKTSLAYEESKRRDIPLKGSCALCVKPAIKEFKNWKVVANEFPYDRVARVHHLLIPYRHVAEIDLNEEEKEELQIIKFEYVYSTYESILEMTLLKKTIPSHAHFHLLTYREDLDSVFNV